MSLFAGVLNWIEYAVSLGQVHPERNESVSAWTSQADELSDVAVFTSLFFPFFTLKRALRHVYPKESNSMHNQHHVLIVVVVVVVVVGIVVKTTKKKTKPTIIIMATAPPPTRRMPKRTGAAMRLRREAAAAAAAF
jgi:cytochrome b561